MLQGRHDNVSYVQLLEGLPQQNLGGAKNVQNSADILTTLDLDDKFLWN